MRKVKVLNLKKKKRSLVGRKELVVVFFAVLFTTLGIKASDTLLSDKQKDLADNGFCAKGMVHVPYSQGDFCIDMYEASAGDNCSYKNPQSQTESRVNIDDPDCQPASVVGAMPWRNLSQDQAARACAKAGKRLASNQEWLQAAMGTPDLPADWQADDCQVAENWSDQPGLSGSGADCISSFGAYDMIGNVWEWVEGVVEEGMIDGKALPDPGYVDASDGKGLPGATNPDLPNPDYNGDYFWLKTKGLRGMVRGGYWNNQSSAGIYSYYAVTPPSSAEAGIGFRCVK
jgi:formylglycine-generating enzyme required for sulfatase activity